MLYRGKVGSFSSERGLMLCSFWCDTLIERGGVSFDPDDTPRLRSYGSVQHVPLSKDGFQQ